MTREEREAAIAYIKGYRKLDEDLHNTTPKDSTLYYVTDKWLKYWDMAIQALSQELKMGHWIVELKENVTEYIVGTGCQVFICSACQEWQDKRSSYCPVCGSRMFEPQE